MNMDTTSLLITIGIALIGISSLLVVLSTLTLVKLINIERLSNHKVINLNKYREKLNQ